MKAPIGDRPAAGAPAAETADPAETAKLLQEIARIKAWEAPVTRGRFTYNDQEFAQSLQKQFQEKGALSPRQLEALRKMLTRYGVLAKAPPKEVAAHCPQCGAKLVERTSRSGKF